MELLCVKDLSKNYRQKKALEHVSFDVNEGEIVALIGKNGAGKTTLMNSIAGIIYPNSGQVLYRNTDLLKEQAKLQEFGILIQATFFDYLSTYENLRLLMMASGVTNKAQLHSTIMDTLMLVGLTGQAKKSVKSFSFGMKQRLGLAQTLLTPISFMILDEPFVGLDPIGKQILKDVILHKAHDEHCGILFSSHDLTDVTEICDRIVMLADGKKVYDDVFHDEKRYVLPLKEPFDPIFVEQLINGYKEHVRLMGNQLIFTESAALYELQHSLTQAHIETGELSITENSLYDFFQTLQ